MVPPGLPEHAAWASGLLPEPAAAAPFGSFPPALRIGYYCQSMEERDPGLQTVAWGSPSQAPEVDSQPASTRIRLEITTRLSEELARFGSVGGVQIQGSDVVLLHPTGARRAPLDEWLYHWDQLDEPTRRLRVSQLARNLARPTSLPVSRPPRAPSVGLGISPWLALGAVAALGAVGALWFVGDFGSSAAAPPPRAVKGDTASTGTTTPPPSPTDPARTGADPAHAGALDPSRASLVCAATRARVVRGATVSVADTEGWVVEYMGFRLGAEARATPLHTAPALAAFFEAPAAPAGSRYIWPGEPELATTPTSEDRVLVREEILSGATPPEHSGVRITFGGALVDAYFRPTTRAAYFHLATALTDALGASEAALYARCADGSSHHLGSWFRGRDHNEAVTALIYSLGTFADPPHLGAAFLRPLGSDVDRAYAFATISRVASAIDRPLLANLVGREGGMVMGRPGEVVTLTFPFDDGNRASRLSREIARLTEIGGE